MSGHFQAIYQNMYSKLVRQAAFLLGDPVVAEDLTQEAFLRLHRNGLANIENPSGWLAKVINNLCFDYMRSEGSRRRREEKVCQQSMDALEIGSLSPEHLVLNREEVRLVHKALKKLQPRDCLVLLMKFSGYSYEEIAEVAALNKSSVGTILARARERFKHQYEEL